jgi:hypothetical protein
MRSPARSDFFAQTAWRILRNASLAGLLPGNIANAFAGESGTEPDDPALFQRVANFIPRLADNGDILACADVDGWLIFAANAVVVKSMIAVKRGKASSLTADPEFQRLSAGLPTDANDCLFTSTRFGQELDKFRDGLATKDNGSPPPKFDSQSHWILIRG